MTPYQRVLPSEYDDEVGLVPKSKGKSGALLPSSRIVSRDIRGDQNKPHEMLTALMWAFGQFVDHDLDHTSVQGNYCLLFKFFPGSRLENFHHRKKFKLPRTAIN